MHFILWYLLLNALMISLKLWGIIASWVVALLFVWAPVAIFGGIVSLAFLIYLMLDRPEKVGVSQLPPDGKGAPEAF
jgi:hypothetical protein